MKNQNDKVRNYSNISFTEIENIVKIKQKDNDKKFEKWFSFSFEISDADNKFFMKLIKKEKLLLPKYNEAKLFARFISRILNKVDFYIGDIKDWYESWLTGEINGVKFRGKTDFMVAKGTVEPIKPYFFISEFKRSTPDYNPEFQLLAEMLVATEMNKVKIMHGCFIIGQHWFFVILEKLENNSYEYFVSESFNCLKIHELKQIYINLQAVKTLFCKD